MNRSVNPTFWVVIPAAGAGRRMAASLPKQYLPLAGKTVIEQTLMRFAVHPRIAGIVVALAPDDECWSRLAIRCAKPLYRVAGGTERCHSVLNALDYLLTFAAAQDWVLVHDAARPCLRREDLDRLIDTLADDPVGGLLAVPVRDTKKRAGADGRIIETVERIDLWRAQTPQMFRLGMLHAALLKAVEAGVLVTDEAAAVERAGLHPRLVEGHEDNIKITRPEDLALAEFYIREKMKDKR